jgi:hypothetical protein
MGTGLQVIESPPEPSVSRWVPMLGVVAGILLVMAPFLSWSRLTIDVPGRIAARFLATRGGGIHGVRIPDARVVLGLGAALLVLSVVALVPHGDALRLHAAIVALAAGSVGLAVSIGYLTAKTRSATAGIAATQVGKGSGQAASKLAQLASHVHVSKGTGLWLALIGGVLAVVASLVGLSSWFRPPATPPPTGPGPAVGPPSPTAAQPPPETAPTEVSPTGPPAPPGAP